MQDSDLLPGVLPLDLDLECLGGGAGASGHTIAGVNTDELGMVSIGQLCNIWGIWFDNIFTLNNFHFILCYQSCYIVAMWHYV